MVHSLFTIGSAILPDSSRVASMTGGMILGGVVLVGTQLIVVGVTIVWYVRSRQGRSS